MKQERGKGWIKAAALLPAGLLLFAVLATVAWGAAQSQGADGPAAVAAGPSILVPAADFNDDGFATQTYAYDDSGGYTYPFSDTQLCMQAPVYLPDGVTVGQFGGYVFDYNDQANINRLELRRVKYLEGTPLGTNSDEMAKSSTTITGTLNAVQWISDSNVEHGLVDTTTYTYYAVVCMDGVEGDSLRLYAVEAFYTP